MNMENSLSSKKDSVLRSITCISVSFVQCVLISVLAICICVSVGLTPKFTISKISSSNYADLAFNEMTQDLNDLSIPAGLPDNFFDNKLDKSEFKQLLISKVSATIKGDEFKVDIDPLKAEIRKHIEAYITDTLSTIDVVWDASLTQFTNECCTIYLQYLSPSVFSLIFSNFAKIFSVLQIVSIILGVIILGLFVFLFMISSYRNFFKFSFSAFAGSGLICMVVPLYLLLTDEISRIGIASNSLYSFIRTFATDFLVLFVLSAVFLLVVSIILLAFEFIFARKEIKCRQASKNT